MTGEDRSISKRIAALESWAVTVDRTLRTAPAVAKSPASLQYWMNKIDPDGKLPEKSRLQMAEAKRSAYFLKLNRASTEARRARRDGAA